MVPVTFPGIKRGLYDALKPEHEELTVKIVNVECGESIHLRNKLEHPLKYLDT